VEACNPGSGAGPAPGGSMKATEVDEKGADGLLAE